MGCAAVLCRIAQLRAEKSEIVFGGTQHLTIRLHRAGAPTPSAFNVEDPADGPKGVGIWQVTKMLEVL